MVRRCSIQFYGLGFSFAPGVKKQSASQFDSVALALMAHRDFSEAELQFRKALKINPRDVDALNKLGVILRRKEKPVEAVVLL